ncbi:hypothetical protein HELRODRAFT_89553 [Helobdella robusta]|uniref:Ubiquitin carboxyl-terminal hydrolase n=1 Tax=Helobdella robusta TaxID=6412 RepID=T1G7E1_HELRO|nr:hypothetical protein HELRODRAFT_89553 [Helobdella robusta]ESN92391.1 hypothetical protein HELRODRAFT_89553 [Helobdella robusta]
MGVGIRNLGNTCFIAATVQCIVRIPIFMNFLNGHKNECKTGKFCCICMMQRTAVSLFYSTEPIVPKEIVGNISLIGEHMQYGKQEDAHDFLLCLLNEMQNQLVLGLKVDQFIERTSAISKIFNGFLRSQIICQHCRTSSNNYEAFFNISLEAGSADSVHGALRHFCAAEDMGNERWYSCDTCKSKQRATKHFTIHQMPNVLILQLKRYGLSNTDGYKISKHVTFEEHLDISSYVSSDGDASRPSQTKYRLHGIVVHQGYSLGSGHYYAYAVDPRVLSHKNGTEFNQFNQYSKRWLYANDSSVSVTDWENVKKAEAYLLFYAKVNTVNSHKIATSPTSTVTKPVSLISTPAPMHATDEEQSFSGFGFSMSMKKVAGINKHTDGTFYPII